MEFAIKLFRALALVCLLLTLIGGNVQFLYVGVVFAAVYIGMLLYRNRKGA